MEKYFEVQAMCGHVGRNKYVTIGFPVIASNGRAAAEKVRLYSRVKHHNKGAILNVRKITFEDYLLLKRRNYHDPYLCCTNIQQQRQIENFEARICSITTFDDRKLKRTEEYRLYKQKLIRIQDITQKQKIQEYYLD